MDNHRWLAAVETPLLYEGTNEVINRLMGSDTLWIVQGPAGRVPILANSQDEATARYKEKFKDRWTMQQDENEDVE